MHGGGVHGRGCVARGVCGMHTPPQILRDTVNERAVRILLECILLLTYFVVTGKQHYRISYITHL